MDAGSIPAGSTLFFFPYAALNSASRLSHGPNVHSFDARLFALPTGKITGVVDAILDLIQWEWIFYFVMIWRGSQV